MPRLIFKCPYIRGGSKKVATHLNNYVRYMATREGAQRIAADKAQLPATKKQQQMVEQLLRDFPLSRGTFEYEDYAAAPTRGNAADFITRALEDNYDAAAKKVNYISYIASRPRAQRTGNHALFTGSDETLTLPKVAEEIAHHPGNVWLPIISLRREDASRLGYDDAERWKSLLTGYAMEIAQDMKIPWDQFRWYAAFHDESHHPHVHMVCYSADGTSGYLTKQGIADIKSGLAKEIFQNDLTELYQQQTQRRDTLNRDAQEVMRELLLRMEEGTVDNPRIEELMTHLADRLQFLSGKKQYGYLKAPLKAVVDERRCCAPTKTTCRSACPSPGRRSSSGSKTWSFRRQYGWENCGKCSIRRIRQRTHYQNRKEQTAPSRGQSPFGMNVLMTAENRTTHGSRYTGVQGPSSKTRKHRRNRRPRRWSC